MRPKFERPFRASPSPEVKRHMHASQRIAVLVDVQNMFYSAKHQFDSKLNFQTLLKARGARVEVFAFPQSTADELRQAATEYYEMGEALLLTERWCNAASVES